MVTFNIYSGRRVRDWEDLETVMNILVGSIYQSFVVMMMMELIAIMRMMITIMLVVIRADNDGGWKNEALRIVAATNV